LGNKAQLDIPASVRPNARWYNAVTARM